MLLINTKVLKVMAVGMGGIWSEVEIWRSASLERRPPDVLCFRVGSSAPTFVPSFFAVGLSRREYPAFEV